MATFLEEDALEQGILVSEHQAFLGGSAMGRLKIVEVGLVDTDGFLELLDVLGASLAEGGLGLAVPLLAFLRGCVDLKQEESSGQPWCLARERGGVGDRKVEGLRACDRPFALAAARRGRHGRWSKAVGSRASSRPSRRSRPGVGGWACCRWTSSLPFLCAGEKASAPRSWPLRVATKRRRRQCRQLGDVW